jgi:phosphoglycolate phosphatase-like HAD superfamily hydrolase
MRLLALDFDGVISNSAPEAFVVAFRCYVAMRPESGLAVSAGLSGLRVPTVDAVREHPLYARFLDLMPLGNRAEDYAVVLSAAEAGHEIPDQAAYDAYRAALDAQWLHDYHKRFYQLRAELVKADPAGWLQLMKPYRPFLEVLRRRAGDALLCIATAKDRASVHRLLHAYGIDDLFPAGRVLDKEAGARKSDHLALLQRESGLPYLEMTFVDDKVNHLADVGRLGVRCALAAWGFNGPREAEQARSAGYLVCSLADVERQLFDGPANP